ncbi:MAG TPA: hypothetical protein VJ749_17905 [Pyrinomonadaceae bacterium]|jgi:hypothetical protein|nr:hypothetical protein [Pyrinomonadaceae bacterium]
MFALLHNRGAAFTRWLSLLLVVFILYGTTVEAAHRHGRTLPSTTSIATHFDNQQSQNLSTNKTGCNDCLICQLHQNFSTTVIALRLKHGPPTQAPQQVPTVAPEDLLSQVISPQAGRAPPRTN